ELLQSDQFSLPHSLRECRSALSCPNRGVSLCQADRLEPRAELRDGFVMKVLVNHKLGINGVYHRDLKVVSFADNQQSFQTKSDFDCFYCQLQPKNLLLHSQRNLKISDFGLSALPDQGVTILKTTCGTPNYVP
ncbi:hypothetical protein HID58_064718, partial [Brassica napus]